MSNDNAQTNQQTTPANTNEEYDFQKAFVEAVTNKSVSIKVNEVALTLTKWNLTQQLKLGSCLQELVLGVLKMIPQDQGPTKLEDMLKNIFVMNKVFADHADSVLKLLTGSLRHNFKTDAETTEFVEKSFDPESTVEVLMLVATLNMVKDGTKKKLGEKVRQFLSQELSPHSSETATDTTIFSTPTAPSK